MAKLQELRAKTGRPHWMLVDETHHLLPTEWDPASLVLAHKLSCMVYVTVHPDRIEQSVLERVDTVIALGNAPNDTIQRSGDATWMHHLREHHYSTWMSDAIKDDKLAEAVRRIEEQSGLPAPDSRH